MIVLKIEVADPASLIGLGYDMINVYKDNDPLGSFTTKVSTLPLVESTTLYEYIDPEGNIGSWYELAYLDTETMTESDMTAPLQGNAMTGPLGFVTIDFVKNTTDFPVIQNMDDAKIGELIFRAETLLQIFADRNCGFNTAYPNYNIVMSLITRALVEEIWIRNQVSLRTAETSGYIMEKIGTYEYRRAAPTSTASNLYGYFTPEYLDMLKSVLGCSPTKIFFTTTQVFHERLSYMNEEGLNIRQWWDGIDEERFWKNWGRVAQLGLGGSQD